MPRTAAAGLRRRISPAGDRHASFDAITVGTMAAASRITSGPVFGSVSDPLKTFPTRPWPATHSKRESNAPAAEEPAGAAGHQGSEPDGDADGGQDPSRLGPGGREQVAEAGEEVGVPPRHGLGHARDRTLRRRAGPVGRQQEEDGGQ